MTARVLILIAVAAAFLTISCGPAISERDMDSKQDQIRRATEKATGEKMPEGM